MSSKIIAEIGEEAMEYISDHPLYASTCGITYEEAIRIANALSPAWRHELVENREFEKLSLPEMEAELKRRGDIK